MDKEGDECILYPTYNWVYILNSIPCGKQNMLWTQFNDHGVNATFCAEVT